VLLLLLLLLLLLCGFKFLQDVSGGLPVQVQGLGGIDLPLYGMQIDLEQARAELKAAVAGGGASGALLCSFV
jgi:hypothetical protein